MKINENLADQYRTMITSCDSLEEINEITDSLTDLYAEHLAADIEAARAEFTDDSSFLASATTAEVLDLVGSRADLQDALRETFFADDSADSDNDESGDDPSGAQEEGAEDEEDVQADDPEDEGEGEEGDEEDPEDEEGDEGDEEDEDAEDEPEEDDEDDADEGEDEGDDEPEAEEPETKDSAPDLDFEVLDEDSFNQEAAQERLEAYDGEVPEDAIVEIADKSFALGDITDEQYNYSQYAIDQVAKYARKQEDGALDLPEILSLATEPELTPNDEEVAPIRELATRLGIADAEDMNSDQLAIALEKVAVAGSSEDSAPQFTTRELIAHAAIRN